MDDKKISELATLLSSGATLNADSLVPMTVELPLGGGLKTVRVKFSELITALGYIPLSGTEVGNPVTGDIEFQEYADIANMYLKDGSLIGGVRFAAGGSVSIFNKDTDTNYESSITPIQNGVLVGATGYAPFGITGYNYYASNYDDNTYTQKKYVDTAMIPLDYGDTDTAGGIENAQVFTTGSGTGIASVNLSLTMLVGKDVTVSDLANNASTHNIQIDAGVGNTILYNGVATQVITLTTNGASVTIRKMTTDKFMVIS